MKSSITISVVTVFFMLAALVCADTFKLKTDGSSFNGFATQKSTGGKTLVFNSDENKMIPVMLSDYEITYNTQGRRDYVVLIPITQPEILLSKVISEQLAASIAQASNTGPQAIILQIDSPGGRGDYMKVVAYALSDTNNCPVAAYISGGTYGGAYSAAAILAMACNQVFMHPNAGIGSVGMAVGQYQNEESYGNYLLTYCSDSLVTYSTYAATLAQEHDRPELLVKALLDKRLSVAEVADRDGSRQFISKQDRQSTQTLIRTLTEGMSMSVSADSGATVSAADVTGKVLNLTAKDAVELGLADKTAADYSEILAEMGIAGADIRPDKGIDKVVKKFQAARRNIQQGLSRIDQLEAQVNTYSEQFTAIDTQLRTATQTREVGQTGVYRTRRDERRFPSNYGYYYDQGMNIYDRGRRTQSVDRNQPDDLERITREEPVVDITIVYGQLTASLRDVVAEYRRVLNLVDRWPGGLPPELTAQTLQDNMNSASNELDTLYRYQPVYPTTTQPFPTNRQRR